MFRIFEIFFSFPKREAKVRVDRDVNASETIKEREKIAGVKKNLNRNLNCHGR